MRAVQFNTYGSPDVLRIDEVATPRPGPGQVRVRVEATAVHPADVIARNGGFAGVIAERSSYRLGWDFAGRIDQLGHGVEGVAAGDLVIGMTDWLRDLNGTHADFVVVERANVVPAPRDVTPDAAASLPVNALTASQALELMPVGAGDTIAVIGAAGGVGGFALELARERGLNVLAVADASDTSFVVDRGGVLVDRAADLVGAVRAVAPHGVDALFDTASVGQPALAAVRDGGTYVGVIYPFAPPSERGIVVDTVGVHHDPGAMTQLTRLAELGRLSLRVAACYPLEQVADAHRHAAKGGTRGAIVLRP